MKLSFLWVVLGCLFASAAPAMHVIKPGDVTHTATASGNWFDATIWNNGIPGPGDVAHVPDGIVVRYAGHAAGPIRAVLVEGELNFATDASSTLMLDTLEVGMDGHLRIGTVADPVQPQASVLIQFTSGSDIDILWDPTLISRGLIGHGKVEIHGARKTVHGKVAADPLAGHTTLTMAQAPQGWNIGDRLVLTGTRYSGWMWDNDIREVIYHGTQDEVLTITAINGATVTFDPPLQYNHTTPRADLKASVANFTRNIRFETQNGGSVPLHRRGHVMLMHHTDFDVRFAQFERLGRTNKAPLRSFDLDQVATLTPSTNLRGRYPLHLHLTGIEEADKPVMVIGNAVFHSPGWGYVHHGSNAHFHDNASFDTHGAGFVAETGDEVGAWTANIAIKAEGDGNLNPKNGSDVDAYEIGRTGAGFWFQGRLVRNVGNVAASVVQGYAYLHRGMQLRHFPHTVFSMGDALRRAENVSPDHPPILNFHDNEAFASAVGLFVVKANPNQEHGINTHISRFTAWEVRIGAEMEYTSHYLLEDIDIIGKTPEPFSAPLYGLKFGNNASDMVVNRAHIADFAIPSEYEQGIGVVLSKEFTDNSHPPEFKQYVMIDVTFQNVAEHYEHFMPGLDRILTAGDLVPDRFAFQINEPLEYNNPNTTWDVQINFTGSKTDSIGINDPFPAGTDWAGVRNQEMIYNVSNDGYYRNGTDHYAVVPIYFTDRASGSIHKRGLTVRLGPDVVAMLGNQWFAWRDAFDRGPLHLTSQPPLALGDTATVARDGEVLIDVLANDSDPDGHPLTVDGIVQPNHGLVFRNPDGTLSYRPDPDFIGTDSFQYWASDGHGQFSSATVTVGVGGDDDLLFADGFEPR